MKKIIILLILFFNSNIFFAQSDFEKTIRIGETLVNGLSFFKSNKTNSKTLSSICVKNKLSEKITFKISGKDNEGNEVKKELIVPNDGKECFLEVKKGIYIYEVILNNKETFKKGEYVFDENIEIVIK